MLGTRCRSRFKIGHTTPDRVPGRCVEATCSRLNSRRGGTDLAGFRSSELTGQRLVAMAPTVYHSPSMLQRAADRVPEDMEQVANSPALATPPNVPDLTPSLCLSLLEFKGTLRPARGAPSLPADMLRQYRKLDDDVNLRFNRTLARARDQGTSVPPSLLQSHNSRFSSMSATDLGKTTYARTPENVCGFFWQELVNVWAGREDTIRYCIAVNAQATKPPPTVADNPDLRLDRDAPPPPPPPLSRGESMPEFTARQLRNELAIESIIRHRSLDAFKSKCRAFVPHPDAGEHGERELRYWQGQ